MRLHPLQRPHRRAPPGLVHRAERELDAGLGAEANEGQAVAVFEDADHGLDGVLDDVEDAQPVCDLLTVLVLARDHRVHRARCVDHARDVDRPSRHSLWHLDVHAHVDLLGAAHRHILVRRSRQSDRGGWVCRSLCILRVVKVRPRVLVEQRCGALDHVVHVRVERPNHGAGPRGGGPVQRGIVVRAADPEHPLHRGDARATDRTAPSRFHDLGQAKLASALVATGSDEEVCRLVTADHAQSFRLCAGCLRLGSGRQCRRRVQCSQYRFLHLVHLLRSCNFLDARKARNDSPELVLEHLLAPAKGRAISVHLTLHQLSSRWRRQEVAMVDGACVSIALPPCSALDCHALWHLQHQHPHSGAMSLHQGLCLIGCPWEAVE
mmetsp:Transcript_15715/g.37527  ORF Transcript_15715/g.37527 Transcript_15715/m.37527 type:complete len:379 (+) Transcript_15715:1404-2540(+)